MNAYTVLYRIESIMSPSDAPFGFVCHADNADHAEEQCLNAYPDCAPVWCAQGDDYGAALEEYWTVPEPDLPEPWGEPLGPEQPWDRRAADYAAADWAAWRTGGPA